MHASGRVGVRACPVQPRPRSHKAQGVLSQGPGCLDAVWMLPRVAAVGPAVWSATRAWLLTLTSDDALTTRE